MPAKQQNVDVEGRQLALSNLDKVLYPGDGFAKVHVIDYYTRVGKWLLPHFSGRPVTMLRFPDGVRGKAFYEKDAPKYTPDWVHTTLVPRQAGGKPIRYICINDLPTDSAVGEFLREVSPPSVPSQRSSIRFAAGPVVEHQFIVVIVSLQHSILNRLIKDQASACMSS